MRKFIFSSTAAVYGTPDKSPITENSARQPVNPYGATKLTLEMALEAYSRAYGLRYVAFRYFNAAGADESGTIGEKHDPETHLIPLILQAIQGKRAALEIFGDDYPTADGTCIRDYIHVNDLAEAHVLGLEYLVKGRIRSDEPGNRARDTQCTKWSRPSKRSLAAKCQPILARAAPAIPRSWLPILRAQKNC